MGKKEQIKDSDLVGFRTEHVLASVCDSRSPEKSKSLVMDIFIFEDLKPNFRFEVRNKGKIRGIYYSLPEAIYSYNNI